MAAPSDDELYAQAEQVYFDYREAVNGVLEVIHDGPWEVGDGAYGMVPSGAGCGDRWNFKLTRTTTIDRAEQDRIRQDVADHLTDAGYEVEGMDLGSEAVTSSDVIVRKQGIFSLLTAVVYGVQKDAAGRVIDPFAGVTNVNVLVGGMFSGLDDLVAWGDSARELNRYADAYGGDGTGSITIAWYGYDSPDLITEARMESATEGAARLSETLRGLDHGAPSSVTTSVIGHSYGSTTAFLAVGGSSSDLGVDRLIAVGSAGVPDGYHASWTGDGATDYSGVEVFASRAPGDGVARFGEWGSFGHGADPETIEGATSFESDGGKAPSLQGTPEPVVGTPGHASHDGGNTFWGWWEEDNGYLSRDSESFRNIANIVANGEVLP
ncbi:MAG: alpha/beta hydrolase [Microbacterium sp.]